MNASKPTHRNLSRKQFLQLSAFGAAGWLTSCRAAPSAPAVTPTRTVPPVDPAAAKTEAAAPQSAVTSRVVHTRGAGVWDGDGLSGAVVRRMLDESIVRLTGQTTARDGWASLFTADDKVAIKVNAFYNSLIWTHVPLVAAVTDSLQEAGVPAGSIVLYDQTSDELKTAGFAVNPDGPGVRCRGTDKTYGTEWTNVGGADVPVSPILKDCTALINMPVLKAHMLAGITFALKNHFGSVQYPGMLHSGIAGKIAALNALPEIKERTRLVIGDVLEANLEYGTSYPYWTADYRGDSILMSCDPVAHDAVGLDILKGLLAEAGKPALSLLSIAESCLSESGSLGLGVHQLEKIERLEVAV
ncbi:MAG: DUF362 domain-containing protein [Anaerolineales bacterium]|nr:DUF362 domain-containing protein [Anaerolineales bacterium]